MIDHRDMIKALHHAGRVFKKPPNQRLANRCGICFFLFKIYGYEYERWFSANAREICKTPYDDGFLFCDGKPQEIAYINSIPGHKTSRYNYCYKLARKIEVMSPEELKKYNLK